MGVESSGALPALFGRRLWPLAPFEFRRCFMTFPSPERGKTASRTSDSHKPATKSFSRAQSPSQYTASSSEGPRQPLTKMLLVLDEYPPHSTTTWDRVEKLGGKGRAGRNRQIDGLASQIAANASR